MTKIKILAILVSLNFFQVEALIIDRAIVSSDSNPDYLESVFMISIKPS